jgi:hypothetical protein
MIAGRGMEGIVLKREWVGGKEGKGEINLALRGRKVGGSWD